MRQFVGLKLVALVSILFFGSLTGYTLWALLDLQDELAVDVGENMVWAAGQATYQSALFYQASVKAEGLTGYKANPVVQRELLRGRMQVLLSPTQEAFMRRAGVLEDLHAIKEQLDNEEIDHAALQASFYEVGRRIMQVERELAGARRDTYGRLMRQLIFFVIGVMGSGSALFILLLGSMRRTQIAHTEISRQHQQGQQLLSELHYERQVRERYRDFVSLMSHQLRTPLAVIDSSAQRLVRADTSELSAMVAERSGRIRRSVRQLNRLISRVLQGVRVDEQRRNENLSLEIVRCDWADVLQQALDGFGDLLDTRRIELEFAAGVPQPLWIECDRLWCAEIMSNLIGNADKYSPAETSIVIRVACTEDNLQCQVLDRGPGIPEQDLQGLFMPFFRGSNGRNTAGVGLGLSISRTLAGWHSGTVSATNRVDGGACFSLTLPLRWTPPDAV